MRSALIIEFNSSSSVSFALGTIYFYKLRFHLFPPKGTVQILIRVLFRYHVTSI